MSSYEFTIANPPLLKDLGRETITNITVCTNAPRIKEAFIPFENLVPFRAEDLKKYGLEGKRVKITLTSTLQWVRLGQVVTLASKENVSVTQSVSHSASTLETLRALLALSVGAEFKAFSASINAEIESTKAETRSWEESTSHTRSVEREAHYTYADWNLKNAISVDYNVSEVLDIVEPLAAQGQATLDALTDEDDFFSRVEPKIKIALLTAVQQIDAMDDNFETLLAYYEDSLPKDEKIVQAHFGIEDPNLQTV